MRQRNLFIGSLMSLTLVATVSMGSASTNSSGEQLYDTLCAACHVKTPPATIAPPVFAMVDHTRGAYPGKTEFVNRVVSWVANPQADQALMGGAIDKFGLMPKLGYSEDQVRLIAEYLYDSDFKKPKGQGGNVAAEPD